MIGVVDVDLFFGAVGLLIRSDTIRPIGNGRVAALPANFHPSQHPSIAISIKIHLQQPTNHQSMSGFPPSRYSIAPTQYQRRQTLGAGSAAHPAASPALLARIQEKKQELDSLMALRDLSGNLASQMQQLGDKLATLADGTEGMRCTLFVCTGCD